MQQLSLHRWWQGVDQIGVLVQMLDQLSKLRIGPLWLLEVHDRRSHHVVQLLIRKGGHTSILHGCLTEGKVESRTTSRSTIGAHAGLLLEATVVSGHRSQLLLLLLLLLWELKVLMLLRRVVSISR